MADNLMTENHVTQRTCLEICAGAGGQALGLEAAGFSHQLAVEIDPDACLTLAGNRSEWSVLEADVRDVDGRDFRGIDLLAGGVPCPPFSVAGHQLGSNDERDLFPEALRLVREAKPAAVMLENVRGLAADRFADYRQAIVAELSALGYVTDWRLLQASDFGVPQLRPRFILVALRPRAFRRFNWPSTQPAPATVGETLKDLMADQGWEGADQWARRANRVAPTLVGGSRKHGGPDLGPTRARNEWLKLGVDGRGIADQVPTAEDPHDHIPRLTLRMAARLQGFPDSWTFAGRKTSTYRQIGNAFPPPVAGAVGAALRSALDGPPRVSRAVPAN
ncbi:MAG: DNA cytosine methyltransferase [Candidatus Nanopelagicales bacterium]